MYQEHFPASLWAPFIDPNCSVLLQSKTSSTYYLWQLTGLTTSLAPGKASGGYGKASCCSFESLGSCVALGLRMVFLEELFGNASAVRPRTAIVVMTEVVITSPRFAVGSPSSLPRVADMVKGTRSMMKSKV